MRTEALVQALAADSGPARGLSTTLIHAGSIGAAAGVALFLVVLGPRPDIAAAAGDARFVMKFVVALALAGAAGGLFWRLLRPGAAAGLWTAALAVSPALLAVAVGLELLAIPAAAWPERLIGRNNLVCLISIPLLAAPLLAGLLAAGRRAAATRPAMAGAVAGALAGGVGAALYAAHCIDDSPLFVATWYGLAIALVTAAGAVLGARLLRW